MQVATHLRFQERPSLSDLFFTMLRNAGPRSYQRSRTLALRASWHDVRIDRAHVQAFHNACALPSQDGISILYPMTLAYPPLLHMLSQRAAPLPLYRALNTRMLIQQYRPLSTEDRGHLSLRVTNLQQVEKGLELDVHGRLDVEGNRVWECFMTFLYRGRFDSVLSPAVVERGDRVSQAAHCHKWRIPARGGFRFGRLCGDTNPIHYGKLWAKMLGFERDFAQPLLVIGQALSHVPGLRADRPLRLEARLKGPVYYERNLRMVMDEAVHGYRFDIYCAPNTRPSIGVQFGGLE